MKLEKYIASVGLALCLVSNCFALPGKIVTSIDTVGGKLEVVNSGFDKCFNCSESNLVLGKNIRILGNDFVNIGEKLSLSPYKDLILVHSGSFGNGVPEASPVVLEISKDQDWRIVNIFGDETGIQLEDLSISNQDSNIVITAKNGWKIILSPELQVLKKEITFKPNELKKKKINKLDDLKDEFSSSILDLPFVKKDLKKNGLYGYLKDLLGGYCCAEMDKERAVISVSYGNFVRDEYIPCHVIWATNKNNYYILLGSRGEFIIASSFKEADIKKITKHYFSLPDFQWNISKETKCYINSDSRSIPCRKLL